MYKSRTQNLYEKKYFMKSNIFARLSFRNLQKITGSNTYEYIFFIRKESYLQRKLINTLKMVSSMDE